MYHESCLGRVPIFAGAMDHLAQNAPSPSLYLGISCSNSHKQVQQLQHALGENSPATVLFLESHRYGACLALRRTRHICRGA